MRCDCGVVFENHPEGRCLDSWLARHIMGWKEAEHIPSAWGIDPALGYECAWPRYSIYIAEAWALVERVPNMTLGHWTKAGIMNATIYLNDGAIIVSADTAPLAICRCVAMWAALKKEETK